MADERHEATGCRETREGVPIAPASPVVRARGVSKRFGNVVAVSDLSFDLGPGQAMALVGPNGAGKTTTLRMLATLLRPDSGEIQIMGKDVHDPFQVRPLIGYMPDVLGVYPEMLVREYLEFFARAYEIEERMLEYRMGEVVAFAGLREWMDVPAGGLSRGMLQRVALARALLHDPKVLLMDEPAAGLDPRARVEFREMLADLLRRGKSAIISSHVLADLEETCDRVTVIEMGRMLFSETMDVFLERARSSRTFRVRVTRTQGDQARDLLANHAQVTEVRWDGEDLLFDLVRGLGRPSSILRDLVTVPLEVESFAEVTCTLEQAYLKRTAAVLEVRRPEIR